MSNSSARLAQEARILLRIAGVMGKRGFSETDETKCLRAPRNTNWSLCIEDVGTGETLLDIWKCLMADRYVLIVWNAQLLFAMKATYKQRVS